jgi:hypothetical protein
MKKDTNFSVCSGLTDDTIPERFYFGFPNLVFNPSGKLYIRYKYTLPSFINKTLRFDCLLSHTSQKLKRFYVDVHLNICFESQVCNCIITASVNTKTNVTHADIYNIITDISSFMFT